MEGSGKSHILKQGPGGAASLYCQARVEMGEHPIVLNAGKTEQGVGGCSLTLPRGTGDLWEVRIFDYSPLARVIYMENDFSSAVEL